MKKAFIAAVGTVSAIGSMLISTPAANAATVVNGPVTCIYHSTGVHTRPVGMWAEAVGGGTSGWASLTPNGTSSNFYYSTNGATKFVLHTGCGGTPQNWASNVASVPVVGYTTVTITW